MAMRIINLLEQAVQGDLRPDLALLLDAPVETGMKRAKTRGKLDRFELEQKQFFEQVRQTFQEQAHKHKHRFKVINAAQPLPDVQNEIYRTVRNLMI